MITIQKTVYFFFDDSGVFHRNERSGYFVYAGYVFCGKENTDNAKRKYIGALNQIKDATGMTGELKAAALEIKHRRSLYNVMAEFDSLSASVELNRIYDYILDHNNSICRYKDYILKRIIKNALTKFIRKGLLSKGDDVKLIINIDEQLTATDGYYTLHDSILEELKHGIVNHDYAVQHPKVFDGDVKVNIHYCDSKHNYLIQASDILANRIRASYIYNNPRLRNLSNHTFLTFP